MSELINGVMSDHSEVDSILGALASGSYEVEYLAPTCIEERKHTDGLPYFIVHPPKDDETGGVLVKVFGCTYASSYNSLVVDWQGPHADDVDLRRELTKKVLYAWGPMPTARVLIDMYARAKKLVEPIEWYDAFHTSKYEKADEFLDDKAVRYSLIECMLCGEESFMRALEFMPDVLSVIHWLVVEYRKGDIRAKDYLVRMMRAGIEIPEIIHCQDSALPEYYSPWHGNPYPHELYEAADSPKKEDGKVTTKTERIRKRIPRGF